MHGVPLWFDRDNGLFTIDFWGPMACFSPPYAKVDRYSYSVPTPSAVRGMLASIYSKPSEFYWAVRKIEIMNPIRYMSCKRNEVIKRLSGLEPIMSSDTGTTRTQRGGMVLRDVKYRITAQVVPALSVKTDICLWKGVVEQARKRITIGQCFMQPYMGTRECSCFFDVADMTAVPQDITADLNLMVFDTHIPYDNRRGESKADISLYHCMVEHGVIHVPDYDSPEVIKLPGKDVI